MTDEKKTREQLLDELEELRLEVERLRVLGVDYGYSVRGMALKPRELEQRVTDNLGWF